MAPSSELVALIEQFVAAMRQEGRAPLTLRNYRQDLLHFATWHQGSFTAVTNEHLQTYLATLLPTGLGALRRKRASLHSFLRWAAQAGYCPPLPISLTAAQPRQRHPVVPTAAQILAQIPPRQHRDRVLFHLLAATGLHLRDVLALRLADCQISEAMLWLNYRDRQGKMRQMAVADSLVVRTMTCRLAEEHDAQEMVFPAQKHGRGGRLGYQVVYERWRGYCRRAGIACRFHDLRAARIYACLDQGMQGTELSQGLGVAPTTLRRYEQEWRAHQAREAHYAIRVELLLPQPSLRRKAETPRLRYDLGHGFCQALGYLACPHRLACVRCAHYQGKSLAQGEPQALQQPIQLTTEEYAGLSGTEAAWQAFCERQLDLPTPAGPTPRQLEVDPLQIEPTHLLVSRLIAVKR